MSTNLNRQALVNLMLIGFSDNDKLTFESILSLADNRLDIPWQITTVKGDADFFVLSNRLRAQFEQDKLLQTLPREQCIFCVLECTDAAEHELLVDKNNIPFLRTMVVLLNKLVGSDSIQKVVSEPTEEPKATSLGFFEKIKPDVVDKPVINNETLVSTKTQDEITSFNQENISTSPPNNRPRSVGFFEKKQPVAAVSSTPFAKEERGAQSAKKAKPLGFFDKLKQSKKAVIEPVRAGLSETAVANQIEPPTALEPSVSAEATFDPTEHPFIRLLLEAATEKKLYFSLFNADELYIDLQNRCYYSAEKLETLHVYFSCQGKFLLQKRDELQLQTIVAKQQFKPQPLNNLLWYSVFCSSQGRVISTHQVSDIVRLKRWPDINLPGCRELIKLAAYMHSNSADLKTVHIKTDFSVAKINDFYNACSVTGLIELCAESDMHAKVMDSEKRELYAKIGKRIQSLN